MTSNALAPYVPQGVAVRPLPQLYGEGLQEQRCPGQPCSLIIRDTVSLERKAGPFLFAEHEEFYQRRSKSSYVPPPVCRNWRGHKQEPPSIRSNLRFSGTYAMEGRFIYDVTEKGIYIDLFF